MDINVSLMKFNLLKIIELPLRSRTGVLRRAPGEGDEWGWCPLKRGCRHSDWGLKQMDFEEILNDCSTNFLVLNNINSSN